MKKTILAILLLLTPLLANAQTTVNGRIMTGELATRPTSCAVADQFNSTDGHGAFLCNPTANTWQPIGGGGTNYQTIQQAGVPLIQEPNLNFPAYVTCVDNLANNSTDCTPDIMVAAGASHSAGLVPDPGPTDNHFPLCQNGQFSSDCQVAVGTLPNPVLTGNIAGGAPWILGVDTVFAGANPYVDVRAYGVRAVNPNIAPAATGITANINSASSTAAISSASTFVNGDGVRINNAGAAHAMATPAAPTVTPSVASASTGTGFVVAAPVGALTRCYKIAARDTAGGMTAASAEQCTTQGNTLGFNSVAITAISRSNNIVTVTTAAPHGLAVGAMVEQRGVTNTQFVGTYTVASVGSSTYTYTSGKDTRSSGAASSSGGTATWYNSNHLVLPAPGAGVYEYIIYAGASGLETLLGATPPVVSALSTDPTYMVYDDFGTTMMGTISLPDFIPNTPPGSATADNLVTTIASGAGTTTLTLAGTAGTTVTGATIRFDNAPNIVAAFNAAKNVTGGMPFFPAIAPQSPTLFSYVTNSYLDLNSFPYLGVSQSGSITLGDTMKVSNVQWHGELTSSVLIIPQFAMQGGTGFYTRSAYSGIWATGNVNFSGLTITSAGNNYLGFFLSPGAIPTATFDNMNFIGSLGATDLMGVPFYAFAQYAAGGAAGIKFTDCLFNTGPTQAEDGKTATPLFISKNFGEISFDGLFLNIRGMFFDPNQAGQTLDMNMKYEEQGGVMPMITVMNGSGGSPGGWMNVKNTILDTSTHPLIANLGLLTASWGGSVTIDGHLSIGTPVVSGLAFRSLQINNTTSSNIGQDTQAEGYTYGAALDGVYNTQPESASLRTENTNVAIGKGFSLFTNTTTPASPTCSVATAGPPFTLAGTYTFVYAAAYPPNNGTGPTSGFSGSCAADGTTQQITINIPAAIPGASGYTIWRGSYSMLTCSSPSTTTLSYVWTGSACGPTVATLPGGGPANISDGNVSALSFIAGATPAPTGAVNLTKSYMDSTLNWPSFKPNGNTAYQYLGVHGSITSGHSACFDSSIFASMVDCPGGGGGGAANPALQNSVAYYADPGTTTTIGGINGLTTHNGVSQFWTTKATGGVAGPPTPAFGGVIPTADANTTYTVVDADRNNLRHFTSASAVAVSLPDASTWGSNPTFGFCTDGAGTVTFTPDTPSTINYWNGSSFTSSQASMPVTTGSCITVFTDNIDYFAILKSVGGTVTGSGLTGGQLLVGNSGSAVTVGNLTGDITTTGGTATTLATVNSNVGSFTAANITVNGKGLVTAAANGALAFPITVTGGTLNHLPYFSGTTTLADAGTNILWDPTNKIFQLGNPAVSSGILKFGNAAGGYQTLTSFNGATNDAFALPVAQTTTNNVLMSNNSHITTTANFILNMSAANATAAAFVIPYGSNAGSTAGGMGFDSGNGNFHVANGASSDRILVPLASGFVSGHCAQPTATANKWELVDLGAACAAGGSGTVNAGTTPRLAYYATSSTAVSDTGANLTWASPTLTIGVAGTTTGQLVLASSTATGSVTLLPASAASAFNVTIPAATDTLVNLNSAQALTTKTINASSNTISNITGAMMTNNTVTATQLASSLALVTPNIGVATGTSLVATGIVDGTSPMTVTTSTPITLGGGTYSSGYAINEHATPGNAITYNLPTAAVGKQYCVANGNPSASSPGTPNTGVLTVATSAAGQFIIFTDGTLSATGGTVTSGGAAGDAACFVGTSTTHWLMYVNRGTWTKH